MSDHLRLRAAMAERGGVAWYAELKAAMGRRGLEAGCRDEVVVCIGHDTYVSAGLDDHPALRVFARGPEACSAI